MDTNAKTQLTNVFAKGMNTDVSDALLGNDQYRLANNLRYVTDDEENTGEMHVIEGAILAKGISGTVRGMLSIRLWGVIITEDEDYTWHVYRFDLPDTLIEVACITGHPLSRNKLSLVTKYEDEKNAKVYIADGESPIRIINIQPDKDVLDIHVETDYNKVTSYPNVTLTPPTFERLINGTLKEGVVLYSYLYYNTWGTSTDASIPTRLIPLHNKVPDLSNLTNFKGVEQGKISNKGVRISIPTNPSFDKIKVFRITYVEAGLLPLIEMILDTDVDISEDRYVIDDTGMEALLIYSLEEYNGISGIHIVPKVIESKDDYMFAAAIKTELSELDERLAEYTFACPQEEGGGVDIYDMSKPLDSIANNYSSDLISWRFITEKLVGDENGNVKELIKLSEDGYANPLNVYNYTSLRRDELYRFGIILYDNKGNHSSVFWVADVRTPSMYIDGYQTFDIEEGKLVTYSLGIEFIVNLTSIADITGYEIVRCNRTEKDIATIAQGVVSRPGRRFSLDKEQFINKYPLTPTGWITTADMTVCPYANMNAVKDEGEEDQRYFYSNCDIFYYDDYKQEVNITANTSVYLFICPEYCYQSDSFKSLAEKDGLTLRLQQYLYGNRFEDVNPEQYNSEDRSYVLLAESGTNRPDFVFIFPYMLRNQDTGPIYVNETDAVHVQEEEIDGSYINQNSIQCSGIYTGNKYTHVPIRWNNDVEEIGGNGTVFKKATIYQPSFIHTWVYYAGGRFYKNTSWDDLDKKDRHQYIKLYNKTNSVKLAVKEYIGNANAVSVDINGISSMPINSTAYVDALGWDDLAEAKNLSNTGESYPLKYINHLKNIGDDSFVNWVSTNLYNLPMTSADGTGWYLSNDALENKLMPVGGIMGPGGKTMLIKIENNLDIFNTIGTTVFDATASGDTIQDSMFGTYLCNVRQNVTPYGGSSDESKKLSNYYSYSYYNSVEETSMNVFGGDCFILPFEYVAMHKYYHNKVRFPRNGCIVYSIPVETNLNLAYTYGYEFSKNFTSGGATPNLQDKPSDVYGFFNQDTPLYMYNGAYSASNKLKAFAAYLNDPTNISNEDYRCYYSNPKNNNESIDNWTIYQPANFLDVDTRKGPITGLRTFHNSLVFWLRDATGLFSVNERTTITDDSNMPLLLGTGGVLARYDYIKTSNGMKENEFADTQSDSTLYWWDHNKADLCAYAGGEDMIVLSKVKNVANFLNKQDRLGKLSDEPMLTFDKKYNEMIAYVTDGEGHEAGSMVYSEQTQAFVGLYAINPRYSLQFADKLYLYQQYGLYIWDESSDNTSKGLLEEDLTPYLKYVVNDNQLMNKVFDNVTFGARVYGGGYMEENKRNHDELENLDFTFSTPLKQKSTLNGKDIENVEYDFRFAIPRNAGSAYGDRMRGKTMLCELESKSNSLDLSIQYITTKYRISWS